MIGSPRVPAIWCVYPGDNLIWCVSSLQYSHLSEYTVIFPEGDSVLKEVLLRGLLLLRLVRHLSRSGSAAPRNQVRRVN